MNLILFAMFSRPGCRPEYRPVEAGGMRTGGASLCSGSGTLMRLFGLIGGIVQVV